jgi:hypothetical protein
MWKKFLLTAMVVVAVQPANAQITIDGTYDAFYGSAIAVQTVETGFGDNQSEWNAVYARLTGNRLNVLITGNIEANFNKLSIFFDTNSAGENVLSASPQYDFFNGSNWISSNQQGMTFDSGFAANYHMYARAGGGNFTVDFVDRLGGASNAVNGNTGSAAYAGGIGAIGNGQVDPGNLVNGSSVGNHLNNSIFWAMNNSNTAGIGGNAGAAANQAAALAVMTGFEFSIDLSDLNLDSNLIRLAIMQGNGDHNYLSNQTFGGLPVGTGNLGGDGAGNFTGTLSGINFNNFAGQQFITIAVPEPGTFGFFALAGLLGLAKRRRSI